MTSKTLAGPTAVTAHDVIDRRRFMQRAAIASAAAGVFASGGSAAPAIVDDSAEAAVKRLHESLSAEQKQQVCFAWDHVDEKLGLLRARVAANWQVTKPRVRSGFYTPTQQRFVREVFERLVQRDWIARFDKQLRDDAEGFGDQSIAIFGVPGAGKFHFVITGRHITLRCDGGSAAALAFGGPIFYGHAASGFNEKVGHPGNIFWHQAVAANAVFGMLDGKQQQIALLKRAPAENAVGFQGAKGKFPGIPVSALSADQKAQLEKVLQKLVEPYRQSDRDRVNGCLQAQGGLERCSLAFYEEGDLGKDRVWDIWRLEGPAFVWHFKGTPHVHTWVHVADNPAVKLNA
jgi:hypothetical protein